MNIKNILVVDDSPTERAALSEILARNNFAVTMAEDGEEAITKAKEGQPDLILMDVVMPGLNGFQTTRTLSGDSATKYIPIIICTTKGLETDKVWGLHQGAKDYVVKPVKPNELIAKINALS
jgi:twitching motility two-component system response regulator PilH